MKFKKVQCFMGQLALGLALLWQGVIPAAQAASEPLLLTSIKPLALIAQAITGTHLKVETLLPITASPHDYPLKMSDHLRLQKAELVLWIGPELESFLAKPLANLPAERVMSAYDLAGIYWPAGEKDAEDADEHHHQAHEHGGHDPHLWLDPRNAIVIAQALAAKLSLMHPELSANFAVNLTNFMRTTNALDQQLALQLKPISARGFGVYHEGYAHFVGRYGLHQLAYVALTPERRPGAKHLQELRQLLAQEGECLFMEPFNHSAAMETMAAQLNLRIGLLDPIGNQEVSSYEQLLNTMGASFLACLAHIEPN